MSTWRWKTQNNYYCSGNIRFLLCQHGNEDHRITITALVIFGFCYVNMAMKTQNYYYCSGDIRFLLCHHGNEEHRITFYCSGNIRCFVMSTYLCEIYFKEIMYNIIHTFNWESPLLLLQALADLYWKNMTAYWLKNLDKNNERRSVVRDPSISSNYLRQTFCHRLNL